VASAGATERDGEVLLALSLVGGEQLGEHGGKTIKKRLLRRVGRDEAGNLGIEAVERA